MRIDVVAVIPQIVNCFIDYSIIKRARDKGIVSIFVHDLRDYGIGKYRQIDDLPYGGGAGMVLRPEPYAKIIDQLTAERKYDEIIMLSPAGQLFDQKLANQLSMKKNIIILCGHYKGVDERVTQLFATKEISIGDYVLTAGELAAAVVIDAVVRLLPGVLGDELSALTDSFQDGLLAPSVYTRPPEFRGLKVPDVLRSGNHAKIAEWQWEQALERTKQRRPDLYQKFLEKARGKKEDSQ
ncbi:MAG: tRNA (guanosine(37)-N1)-methyltransferase TrmD [Chlorobi bacterium]|nr:tRNA (guanosine(37)-N1)-methyltransferase TrmD [Chlorobiota bacterium]